MEKEKIKYEVRWRHISLVDRLTPLFRIPIEITVVFAKPDAMTYDLQIAIAEEFKTMNFDVDDIIVENFYPET